MKSVWLHVCFLTLAWPDMAGSLGPHSPLRLPKACVGSSAWALCLCLSVCLSTGVYVACAGCRLGVCRGNISRAALFNAGMAAGKQSPAHLVNRAQPTWCGSRSRSWNTEVGWRPSYPQSSSLLSPLCPGFLPPPLPH